MNALFAADPGSLYVLLIIVLALVFDYLNGFHDAANSIATVVSTRVLTPGFAVIWAAFFNFVAVFVLGEAVAKTIGKGIVVTEAVNNHVLLSALVGAICWNLLTWWLGLPTSSSHALIGRLVGAAVCYGGPGAVIASAATSGITVGCDEIAGGGACRVGRGTCAVRDGGRSARSGVRWAPSSCRAACSSRWIRGTRIKKTIRRSVSSDTISPEGPVPAICGVASVPPRRLRRSTRASTSRPGCSSSGSNP